MTDRCEDPEIRVTLGFTGTKFLSRGMPFQWKNEDPVQVDQERNIIFIDYSRSGILYGPKPDQVAAFASAIIHESTHAYNTIKNIGSGGLKGALEEEQRTRKGEMKGLEQIKARLKEGDLIEATERRIKKAKGGGLTKRKIAEDLVSAGDATYLEDYYISQSLVDLTAQKEKFAGKPGMPVSPIVTDLAPLETFAERDFDFYAFNIESTILFNSPETSGPSGASPGTHSAIRNGNAVFLLDLLDRPLTLKQLTELKRPRLSDEESFLYYHILLLRAYQIKNQVAKAWEEYAKAPDPSKRAETMEKNAREFLGRSKGYTEIKD